MLAYQYSDVQLVHLLTRLDLRVEVVPAPTTLEDVLDIIVQVAILLDEEVEGERIRQTMRRTLMAARGASGQARPLAVIYAPGGYSPGFRSLPGALLEAAGYRNLSAELGNAYGATLPLEQLLAHQPDLIIVDDDEPDKNSLAQRRLEHPALRRGLPGARTVRLSGRYWSCPTPAITDAVGELQEFL